MKCPCDSTKEYKDCCEPILKNAKLAKTAEQLMRSRYTAFTQINMDYVYNTHDPKTRTDTDMQANKSWAEGTDWLGLEIVKTEEGHEEDSEGIIEFKAKFNSGDGEEIHHEISTFKKRGDQWFFSKAKSPSIETVKREAPKVGRNDPCPCGSGKKYKKCCAS